MLFPTTIVGRIPHPASRIPHPAAGLAPRRCCEAGIAIVPESRRLFGAMSVLENLKIGSVLPAAKARRRDTPAQVLAQFPAMQAKLAQAASELAGGQQSKFASRQALAGYAEHPEHQRVKRALGNLRLARHQVDYEGMPADHAGAPPHPSCESLS